MDAMLMDATITIVELGMIRLHAKLVEVTI